MTIQKKARFTLSPGNQTTLTKELQRKGKNNRINLTKVGI